MNKKTTSFSLSPAVIELIDRCSTVLGVSRSDWVESRITAHESIPEVDSKRVVTAVISEIAPLLKTAEIGLQSTISEYSKAETSCKSAISALNYSHDQLVTVTDSIQAVEHSLMQGTQNLISYAKSIEITGRKALEESTKRISAPAEKVMKQLAETIISIGQLRHDLAVSAQNFSRKTFRDLIQFYMTILIALLLVVFARSSATGIQVGHTELIAVASIMAILILFFDNPFRSKK